MATFINADLVTEFLVYAQGAPDVSLVTREIVKNPNIRILYASETYGNSKQYLSWVRRQLEENLALKAGFGDFVGKFVVIR